MIALGSYILLFFVSRFGNDAIAGFSSAGRYEQLLFLPLLGLSTAVTQLWVKILALKTMKEF